MDAQNTRRRHSGRLVAAAGIFVFALSACTADETAVAPEFAPSFSQAETWGNVILCKYTPEPTSQLFDFDVTATGGRVPGNGSFSLASSQELDVGPECMTVWNASGAGDETVTITEDVPLGWELYAVFNGDLGFFDPPENPHSFTVNETSSTVVVFKNRGAPIDMAPGRMTGGGGQWVAGDLHVTRGFTIHCDITLSNNVEINWEGYRWHIDKPLTSAYCVDDPAVEPAPPEAPFDTFHGEAYGRLNNVDGSFLRFTFVDSGEPGGRNDWATIQIWAPGADPLVDDPILDVDQQLDHGNLQAHYDQPHK